MALHQLKGFQYVVVSHTMWMKQKTIQLVEEEHRKQKGRKRIAFRSMWIFCQNFDSLGFNEWWVRLCCLLVCFQFLMSDEPFTVRQWWFYHLIHSVQYIIEFYDIFIYQIHVFVQKKKTNHTFFEKQKKWYLRRNERMKNNEYSCLYHHSKYQKRFSERKETVFTFDSIHKKVKEWRNTIMKRTKEKRNILFTYQFNSIQMIPLFSQMIQLDMNESFNCLVLE